MMDCVKKVEVKTESRPYEVEIESGLLRRSGERIRELFPDRSRFFVITTAPIKKHWGAAFTDALTAAAVPHQVIEIADGERYKNLNTIEDLADKLIRRG